MSVEQAADARFVGDTLDRFAEQRCDRQVADPADLTVPRGAGRTRFMPKPWHIDDMANCVNEVLGQSRVA